MQRSMVMKYNTLISNKDTNKYYHEIYEKLKHLHQRILHKCDNPKDKKYSVYGGRGVTYSDSWRDRETFISDVLLLDGFNYRLVLEGKLHLDKDTKIPDSKIYSKETCVWLTNGENEKYKTSRWHDMYAYNYYTNTLYLFNQKVDFRRRFNLSSVAFGTKSKSMVRSSNHTGWITWDSRDKIIPRLIEYTYYSPNGIKVISLNQSTLVDNISWLTNTVVSRTKDNTIRKLQDVNTFIVTKANGDRVQYSSLNKCSKDNHIGRDYLTKRLKKESSFTWKGIRYTKEIEKRGYIGLKTINPQDAKYKIDMRK